MSLLGADYSDSDSDDGYKEDAAAQQTASPSPCPSSSSPSSPSSPSAAAAHSERQEEATSRASTTSEELDKKFGAVSEPRAAEGHGWYENFRQQLQRELGKEDITMRIKSNSDIGNPELLSKVNKHFTIDELASHFPESSLNAQFQDDEFYSRLKMDMATKFHRSETSGDRAGGTGAASATGEDGGQIGKLTAPPSRWSTASAPVAPVAAAAAAATAVAVAAAAAKARKNHPPGR